MTFRTSSATRFRVVSRSSVVLTTSATSSSSGSTFDFKSDWGAVVSTNAYDTSRRRMLKECCKEVLRELCGFLAISASKALTRHLRRAHSSQNLHSGAGPDAIRAGGYHGKQISHGADPTRCFHSRPRARDRTQQAHIFHGSATY